jgi:hypothetical protein
MSDSYSLDDVDYDRIIRHAERRYQVAEDRAPPSFLDDHRLGRERYGAPARISGRRYLGDPVGSELVPHIEIEPSPRRRSSPDFFERPLRRPRHSDVDDLIFEREKDRDSVLIDGLRGRHSWRETTTIERSPSRHEESVSLERRRSRSRRRFSSTVGEESVRRFRRRLAPAFPRSLGSSPVRTREVVVREIEPRPFLLPRRRSYSLHADIRARDTLHVDRVVEVRRDYRAPSPRVIRALMATLT